MSLRSQTALNQRTHIPAHIEQAMNQHLQQSMPQHLKKYIGSDAGYVPAQAQRQIAQYMGKSMPGHLKQYAGAYVQQKVIDTAQLRPGQFQPSGRGIAPLPDRLRLDHTGAVGTEQFTVQPETIGTQHLFQASSPGISTETQSPPTSGSDPYNFIMNPEQPKRPSLGLPSGNSMLVRIGMVAGGLIVLLIIFGLVKSILSSSGNFPALLSVAQDQQAIIHLVSNATQTDSQSNAALSTDNQNFAATTQLSMTSTESQLLQYLKNNGHRISTNQLNLKVSSSIDNQLSGAQTDSSVYNQTFQQIMQSELNRYEADLNAAYKLTTGPKGHALLINEYKGAQLLLTQMKSPTS